MHLALMRGVLDRSSGPLRIGRESKQACRPLERQRLDRAYRRSAPGSCEGMSSTATSIGCPPSGSHQRHDVRDVDGFPGAGQVVPRAASSSRTPACCRRRSRAVSRYPPSARYRPSPAARYACAAHAAVVPARCRSCRSVRDRVPRALRRGARGSASASSSAPSMVDNLHVRRSLFGPHEADPHTGR